MRPTSGTRGTTDSGVVGLSGSVGLWCPARVLDWLARVLDWLARGRRIGSFFSSSAEAIVLM